MLAGIPPTGLAPSTPALLSGREDAAVLASIPSPSRGGLGIGPFEVHVYGLMYAMGVALAVLITVRRWEAAGGSRQTVYDVALWAFPAGLIGGRIYFDITSFSEMPHTWYGPIAVWDGGLGIWGGVAAGAAVGIWRLRRARIAVAPVMDAVAPALLVAQAIGRIGNYFKLKGVLRHARVGCCGTCMDARGIVDTALVEGARRSTLAELTDWVLWADQVPAF
jgi:hypothetical protein